MKDDKWHKIFDAFGTGDKTSSDKDISPKNSIEDNKTGWIDITKIEKKEMHVYGLQKDGILTSHMLIILPIEETNGEREFYHVVHEMHEVGEVFGGYKILTYEKIKELFQIDLKAKKK